MKRARRRARNGRYWLLGGAVALLLGTGGYYTSAQGITLHMAGGSGTSGTTTQRVRLGGATATVSTTTTEPAGDQGFRLNDWLQTGPESGTTAPSHTSRAATRPPEPATPTTAPVTAAPPARTATTVTPVAAAREHPAVPTTREIETLLAHYTFDRTSDWLPMGIAHFSDGHGGSLTVVVANPKNAGNGEWQEIFVWHNTTFLGLTTTQGVYQPRIQGLRGGGFAVTYYQWANTPWADMDWTDASKHQTIRYTWNGTRLVPSYTGPVIPTIPPYSPPKPGQPAYYDAMSQATFEQLYGPATWNSSSAPFSVPGFHYVEVWPAAIYPGSAIARVWMAIPTGGVLTYSPSSSLITGAIWGFPGGQVTITEIHAPIAEAASVNSDGAIPLGFTLDGQPVYQGIRVVPQSRPGWQSGAYVDEFIGDGPNATFKIAVQVNLTPQYRTPAAALEEAEAVCLNIKLGGF